jgi:MFS family permease
MLQRFGPDAKYIFLSGQLGYPIGYFIAGWLSDKTKRIRFYGYLFSLLLIPSQYLLFEPNLNFFNAILLSGIVRFLFAASIQMMQIAALEELQYYGFSVSRAAGTLGFFCMQILMFLLESVFFKENLSLEIESARGGQLGAMVHILTFLIAFYTLPKRRKSENPYFFKEVFLIITKNRIWIFFFISFLYYFSYQIVDFYLGAYFRELGGMKYVYLSWFLAVIFEIPFFPITQKFIHKFSLKMLFVLSILTGLIRFLFLVLHGIGFNGKWILVTQLLHGIHFTAYMAGSIYFFHKRFPEHLYGTAFGIFIIISLSSGTILGNLLYGTILKFYGFTMLFFLSFVVHLILLIINICNKNIDTLFR